MISISEITKSTLICVEQPAQSYSTFRGVVNFPSNVYDNKITIQCICKLA